MKQHSWYICILFILCPLFATAQKGTNGCIDLRTGKILESQYCVKAVGPVVWGTLTKEGFEPSREIGFTERLTKSDPKMMPGWIELRTGQIHQMNEGRAPQEPYLRGTLDPKGGFYVDPQELKQWSGKKDSASPKYEPRIEERVPPISGPSKTEPVPIVPRAEEAGGYMPAIQCDDALAQLPTLDLLQGYNSERRTHLTTARSVVIAPRGVFKVSADEFSIVRNEGRIFATGMLQPPGTIPLYSWHSVQRTQGERPPTIVQGGKEDHLRGMVTTSPALSGANQVILFVGESQTRDLRSRQTAGPLGYGWEFLGTEGYIFAHACPGTLPLYGWYNPRQNDYITTTDAAWSGHVGDMKEGYHLIRIEGYILPPR